MKLETEYQKCFPNKQRLNFLQGNDTKVGMLGEMKLLAMSFFKMAHNYSFEEDFSGPKADLINRLTYERDYLTKQIVAVNELK